MILIIYLFKDVHEAFGELALENPDTNFRIKAKYADIHTDFEI